MGMKMMMGDDKSSSEDAAKESMGMKGMKMGDDKSSSEDAAKEPEVATYLISTRPEGSEVGPTEGTVYLSTIGFGGVVLLDLTTGETEVVVEGGVPGEKAGLGLITYGPAILVANGGPPFSNIVSLSVYNAATGELIAVCLPPSDVCSVINDVVVKDGYAYATCSDLPVVLKFDADELLAGNCVMGTIPLEPASVFDANSVENAGGAASNGIIPYKNGLLISAYTNGSVYYLDLKTLETTELISGLVLPDGLALKDDTLYIVSNLPAVYVYELSGSKKAPKSAAYVQTIVDDAFETLATGVFVDDNTLVVADLTSSIEFGAGDFDPTSMFKAHAIHL